ncbi:MAG TPA: ATP-binding protein [bacterium]|nr:ATP-binding protein [bacterium]
MSKSREKFSGLAVAGTALIAAAWFGLTLMLSRPLGSWPSLVSLAGLAAFIAVCSYLVGSAAFWPLRRTRELMQSVSGMGFRDRLYVEDTDDDAGMIQLELNGLLDRLEDALARQRQFVGAISHDIRTPLTIIKGDIEVALMRARTPAEYQEILRSNQEEVERIRRLVEDLLTLARAEHGELGLNVRAVSLSTMAVEARESMNDLFRRKGLTLDVYIEGEVRVEGDQAKLRQVLHNLLENAAHYTPAGGRVELTVFADVERDEAQMRVRDTGVGISPRDLPHIFEPFYRGTPSRRTRHDGYGLGLSICDHIVRAHGGSISVESRQGPGSGSTFSVRLPRRPAGASSAGRG